MMIWAAVTRFLAESVFGTDFATIRNKISAFTSSEHKTQVPIDAVLFLVAGEDRRFFSHPGVDVIGIVRAVRNYLFYGRVEGGSTIEQQLVRVLTGRYERTLPRKLREIILASAICGVLQKEDAARAYIFYGYYGWRMNGMLQAQNRHGKRLIDMDELQLAKLIARLKYPEPKKATSRVQRRIEARARYLVSSKDLRFLQSNSFMRNETI